MSPTYYMRGFRGGGPEPLHLENHKAIGHLAILVQFPWKITKLPSQHSFKWRFAGGLMVARFYWYLDPLFPLQLSKIKLFQS